MELSDTVQVSFYLSVFCVLISFLCGRTTATVMLIGNNLSLSFDDIEANFAPAIKGSGECGKLYVAEPLDACEPLTNEVVPVEGVSSPFVLIIRGGCTFEEKVRRAQSAGFKAAIVYDNEDSGVLVAMAGTSAGIKIHAVFVSKASGEVLKKYAGSPDMLLWIISAFENSSWSIMAISFISLLAMSAVLATCFFVRRHRHIQRERPRVPNVREFHGMSSRLVKAMPSLIFTSVLEDNCTSRTCAICLEDYNVGERLRVLPCFHKFHADCVDAWLTTWRTFCPVCKRDARKSTGIPAPSECTPLLSSAAASPSSSVNFSSVHSSQMASSAIQIVSPSHHSSTSHPQSISSTHTHSVSNTPYMHYSLSSNNSPGLSASRSSVDLRHVSSQRSHASQFVSHHSLGFPLFSPLNSRCASAFAPSSSKASPSYLGSSNRQTFLRHCSESATSMSPFTSAESLPGC